MSIPKMSIIVPVYNVELYLRRCIDSILAQTFADFELLLIDDGSKDGSGKICDEYAEKDSRVKVFHKENGGVGSARNMGLNEARGEWIYFSDSDDELIEDGLQTLINGTISDCNLVVAGYERLESEGLYTTIGKMPKGVLSSSEMLKLMFHGVHPYQGYLWNKLYRRSDIEENKIRFDEAFAFNEDRLFTVEYLCKTNGNVFITDTPVYRYYVLNGGAMVSLQKGFNRKFISDIYAFDRMLEMLKVSKHDEVLPLAKISIYVSYYMIAGMMKKWHVEDADLKNELHGIIQKQVSKAEEFYYMARYIYYPNTRHKIKLALIYCKEMIVNILPPPDK